MSTMNKSPHDEQAASVTAQVSRDAMGLGRTSGQRTAEMVAGLRYELDKTDLNIALSRFAGRLVARMLVAVLRDKSQMNYILARPAAFKELTRRYVEKLDGKLTLVEIAAGFSPRGIEFAQEMPQISVIEIDLPDVVADKQRRLSKSHTVTVPANIQWYGADLGVESLEDVLKGEKVDIVSAEGLNPYFNHEDITRIAEHVRASLKPGGVYISDIGWEEVRQHTEHSSLSMFSRQASSFLGTIRSEDEGVQLLANAGYTNIETYRPSLLTAEMPDVPTTPSDYSVIFLAYNPESSEEETKTELKDSQKPDTSASSQDNKPSTDA